MFSRTQNQGERYVIFGEDPVGFRQRWCCCDTFLLPRYFKNQVADESSCNNQLDMGANTRDFGTYRIYVNYFLNMYARLPSGARDLTFGLRLHLCPYFMYARKEGSDVLHTCAASS